MPGVGGISGLPVVSLALGLSWTQAASSLELCVMNGTPSVPIKNVFLLYVFSLLFSGFSQILIFPLRRNDPTVRVFSALQNLTTLLQCFVWGELW